jgi:hypothetical protein
MLYLGDEKLTRIYKTHLNLLNFFLKFFFCFIDQYFVSFLFVFYRIFFIALKVIKIYLDFLNFFIEFSYLKRSFIL